VTQAGRRIGEMRQRSGSHLRIAFSVNAVPKQLRRSCLPPCLLDCVSSQAGQSHALNGLIKGCCFAAASYSVRSSYKSLHSGFRALIRAITFYKSIGKKPARNVVLKKITTVRLKLVNPCLPCLTASRRQGEHSGRRYEKFAVEPVPMCRDDLVL